MKKIIYLLLFPFYLFGDINNEGLYRLSSEIKNEDLNASAKIELENNQPKYKYLNLDSIRKIDKLKLNRKSISLEGSGFETRSFIYIDDFVDALNIIYQKGKNGNIYNIGTNEEITIINLLSLLQKKMNTNI